MRYRVRRVTSPPPTPPGNSRKRRLFSPVAAARGRRISRAGESRTLGRKALELAAAAVLSGLRVNGFPETSPRRRCAMNLADEIAALARRTVPELRERYAALFGEGTTAKHKTWLVKRIAWRLQAVAEGELSERARQRALQLANDADLRLSPPKPTLPCAEQTGAEPPATAEPAGTLTPDGVPAPPRYAD